MASHGRFPGNVNIPHARGACVCDLEEECAPIPTILFWTYSDNVPEYDNSSVGEEEHFEMRHLIAAITDWQVCPYYFADSKHFTMS